MLTLVVADAGAKVVARGGGARLRDQAGREVVGTEDRPLGQDHGPLQRIVELADVSLPGGGHQAPDRGVIHAVDALAQPPGVPGQEGRHQLGDILAAVSQGGQVDRDDVEPVIEIGSKPPGGDLGLHVLVRGRDHPRPKCDRPGCADRKDLLALDGPKQLRLDRRGHLADLVEEDRPPARRRRTNRHGRGRRL